jgi:single-strand DNA-binding protein
MSASLNKVMLIGNLGENPEVRTTPGGATVANFRVACTESWKDKSGQKQERTEWVTIVAWKVQAEIAQKYLRKGSRVYVEGKLQTRSWDATDGRKRYATEVLCDRFMMLDGKAQDGGGSPREERPRPAQRDMTPPPDDDLPF